MTQSTKNTIAKPYGTITIYGCGGTGVKNAALFEQTRGVREEGMADVTPYYVDTAFSDLPEGVDKAHVYLLPNADGSGGLRRENASVIMEHAPKIIETHVPGDLNIVISSASGGSGSVFSPAVASELIAQGKQVIMILIGDGTTVQFMTNTMNTIRSANGIAQVRDTTVPLVYFENTADTTEDQVNAKVAATITGITALWSRQNHGLDTKDLHHFLNPDLITDFPPQLAMLQMYFKEVPKDVQEDVMTVASLAKSREEARLPFVVDAHYVGAVPSEMAEKITKNTPIHLVMRDQSFNEIMEELEEKKANIRRARGNRNVKGDIMGKASVAANGLVL